jgi:exodeoxyribonuclease-5
VSNPTDKRLTAADLSPDQAAVYDAILTWAKAAKHHHGDVLTMGGFAGSGKSSILGVLASSTKLLVAYVAFTGRAASVLDCKLRACGVATTTRLRRTEEDATKGFAALFDDTLKHAHQGPALCTTIHRLLYKPVVDAETEELKGFSKRDKLDRRYDLIVVDEASMVSDTMLEDIKTHGVPILAVGDHGQLPPVKSSGSCVANPTLRLEKIHRQAAGNPIIRLSAGLRTHGKFLRKYDGGDILYTSKANVQKVLQEADVKALSTGILCWMNRTRVKLNGEARVAAGFRGPPRKGEPLLSLKNKPPVYNGMRGVAAEDSNELAEGNPWELSCLIEFPDEGFPATRHTLCAPQFNREKIFADVAELRARGIDVRSMAMVGEFYDFGYALTVHKSQGSSFQHAVVYCDRPQKPDDEDWRRWAYTAVTRASEKLTVLL